MDPVRGVPGAAFVFTEPPGSNWLVVGDGGDRQDLAIEITARPVATAVPNLTTLGMAIVSGVLALGGIYLIQRSRPEGERRSAARRSSSGGRYHLRAAAKLI